MLDINFSIPLQLQTMKISISLPPPPPFVKLEVNNLAYQFSLYEVELCKRTRVVDPHCFQCGSGASILVQCEYGTRDTQPKIVKFYNWKKIIIIRSKIAMYFHERCPSPSYRRSDQPSKENSQLFKMKQILFLYLWAIFDRLDPDPDGQNQSESMRIRINNSAYRTLHKTFFIHVPDRPLPPHPADSYKIRVLQVSATVQSSCCLIRYRYQ